MRIIKPLVLLLDKIYLVTDTFLAKIKIPQKFRSKMIISVYYLLVISLVVLIAFSRKEDAEIPTYKIKKAKFLVAITESGEIKAKRSNMIMAPRIRNELKITYLIPEGTMVEPGDTCIKFDPSEAINKLREAEAQYELALSERDKLVANQQSADAQSESSLQSARLSFELSKLNLQQMKFEAPAEQQKAKLQHQKDSLSYVQAQQDYKSKKIIRKSETARMDIEIAQKKNNLEKAKKEIDDLTLSAPTKGLIVYEQNYRTDQKFAVGDTPWPGQSVITLPDLTEMESKTSVNEVDVSKINIGQKVLVKLDAFQDTTFSGVISSVAKLGKKKNRESNIKTFELIVDIKGYSDKLKPGMTTSNKMIIQEIKDTLFIPQESVFEKDGKNFVFVKNGSGFDRREVVVGSKSEDYIIIVKGLSENEIVALIDPNDVKETEKNNSVNIPNQGK